MFDVYKEHKGYFVSILTEIVDTRCLEPMRIEFIGTIGIDDAEVTVMPVGGQFYDGQPILINITLPSSKPSAKIITDVNSLKFVLYDVIESCKSKGYMHSKAKITTNICNGEIFRLS